MPPGIGDAARALGTTPRTLRYYEQLGLLVPQRDDGGRRRYDDAALAQARRLLTMRRLGLPLSTVAQLRDAEPGAVLSALGHHADRVTREIDELNALRSRLSDVLAALPDEAGVDHALNLLEEIDMRIRLTRIYTRTGDDGTTSIDGTTRVAKTDERIEVMGDVDELVSALGVVIAQAGSYGELLRTVQNDLFDLGADIAVTGAPEPRPAMVDETYVLRLENLCDEIGSGLATPSSFVLPGAGVESAALHQARAVCRRAERHGWAAAGMPASSLQYLNRLSDLLFILARAAEPAPEPTWAPARHEPAVAG